MSAAADRIDAAADGLRAAHAAVHGRIAAGQAGWVGTSAAALSGATAKWQEQSAASYTEIIGHATDRIVAPEGDEASVETLVDWGFLKEMR